MNFRAGRFAESVHDYDAALAAQPAVASATAKSLAPRQPTDWVEYDTTTVTPVLDAVTGHLLAARKAIASNDNAAGAEALQKTSIGFTSNKEAGDEMAEIKRMFTPEFRNRLDGMISFKALDTEIILRVVDKFLMQLEGQLHEKKVEAIFTDALRAWLAEKGFDPLMGARPMARLIQDFIRAALADELLFGRLQHGGHITIDLDADEKIKLVFEETEQATAAPSTSLG